MSWADADAYIDSVLDRPGLYGVFSVGDLQHYLVGLLAMQCLVLGSECDPVRILFHTYREQYGTSPGATGPSARLAEKFGVGPKSEGTIAFYRAFVRAVNEELAALKEAQTRKLEAS